MGLTLVVPSGLAAFHSSLMAQTSTILKPKGRMILLKIVRTCQHFPQNPAAGSPLQSEEKVQVYHGLKALPTPSAHPCPTLPPHCFLFHSLARQSHLRASALAIPLAWNTLSLGSCCLVSSFTPFKACSNLTFSVRCPDHYPLQ